MAHTKAQDELQKRYEEVSQSLEDPEVEHMISQADEMMGKPARMLIAQAGLSRSTTANFVLLDHGCGTGLIASCLQEVIRPSVLSQSRIFVRTLMCVLLIFFCSARVETNGSMSTRQSWTLK